ncbi:L,D-transpeptidase [Pseudonocardiaceae bacterium YIM PH 21723]|nr:L,D-transpeptidase [Pseudonocardiaceae bacterium YIM PH 21723]
MSAVALALLGTMLTACGGQDAAAPVTAGPVAEREAVVVSEPADGAKDLNPAAPVVLKSPDGEIASVAFTTPGGTPLKGTLAEDKHSWTLGEALGFGKTYAWTATAKNKSGKVKESKGSLTTVAPGKTIAASLDVGDNQTYGVGKGIGVKFNAPVPDRAAAQKALTVKTSVPVEGAWGWVSDSEVRWRPKLYWPANTTVHLDAKIYAVPFGPGVYGAEDLTADFTIGRNLIIKGDVATHRVIVEQNDQPIADYPASFGLDSAPDRNTPNGAYVIMEKTGFMKMTSQRYGYTDIPTHNAMLISTNGEFLHELESNRWNLGKANTSHGCINLGMAESTELFNWALVGDPVVITNSGTTMPAGAEIHDWQYSWAEWQAKSAL